MRRYVGEAGHGGGHHLEPVLPVGELGAKGEGVHGGAAVGEEVHHELGDDEAEMALERAWLKISRRTGMTEDKLLAALVRRGFQVSRVRALIKGKSSEDDGTRKVTR